MDFIAIDFETANSSRSSACEIGLVKVLDSKIVERTSFLIKPKPNFFESYNTYIHGIDSMMVENEPEFDVIYSKIKSDLESLPILAHNAAFDFSVLRNTLDLFSIEYPKTTYSCTYQMSRESLSGLWSFKLKTVADHFGIEFDHHRALSDAEACAKIALRIFEDNDITIFADITKKLNLFIGKTDPDGYTPSRKKKVDYKISELEFDNSKFQEDNLFYEKQVVFTGKLDSMTRKEAQVMILEIGGNCTSGVTQKTDFLILGEQDFDKFGEGFKSSKIKKAEALLAKGKKIELLSESQFLELVNND